MYDALDLLQTYEYIVEIRNLTFDAIVWQQNFVQTFYDYGKFTFESHYFDYIRWDGRMDIANYKFIPKDEIVFSFNKPEINHLLLPNALGYFCFRLDWSPHLSLNFGNEHREFLLAVFRESMGLFITKDKVNNTLNYLPCVKLGVFPATDLDKYSLGDGDILLSRDNQNYMDYAINQVRQVYIEQGLTPMIGVSNTCHNPIRLYLAKHTDTLVKAVYDLQGNIVPEDLLEEKMKDVSFQILIYDFDNLDIIYQKYLDQSVTYIDPYLIGGHKQPIYTYSDRVQQLYNEAEKLADELDGWAKCCHPKSSEYETLIWEVDILRAKANALLGLNREELQTYLKKSVVSNLIKGGIRTAIERDMLFTLISTFHQDYDQFIAINFS
jgi:hypothetical protein